MKRKVVDTRYAKSSKYLATLKQIEARGVCPFCPEHFVFHTRPILRQQGDWFITRNFRPYPGTRLHLIVVRRYHAERLRDLTPQDFVDLQRLVQWAERTFKIQGGGITMRFGNTRYTGATVCHIHAHLIVPKLEYRVVGGRRQRLARIVNFPIG